MSQFYFAVFDGQFGKRLDGGQKRANQRHKIARSVDSEAGYVYYHAPGEHRWYGHGYCRNYGAPFDEATARAICEAWEAAGV